jgi:hypothetical protein
MNPTKEEWPLEKWSRFSPWPSSLVLDPLGVGPDDLALIGRIGTRGAEATSVVPLHFYFTTPPGDPWGKYVANIKPVKTLQFYRYRVIKGRKNSQEEVEVFTWKGVRGAFFEPIKLLIDLHPCSVSDVT